jgi:membrane protease YdiL (CAAX protease family)
METHRVAWRPIVVSLLLIAAYPPFSLAIANSFAGLASRIGWIEARVVTEAAVWLYGAVVLAIALLWERRTLASIGLRKPTLASLAFAAVGVVAMFGATLLASFLVYGLLHQPSQATAKVAAAMVGGSAIYAAALSLRAGVIEEILFRGLAIEQLTALTGQRWFAAVLSTVIFVAAHGLRFDWPQLVPVAGVGIVLAGLYLWRHDMWANIIAHAAVDAATVVPIALSVHK